LVVNSDAKSLGNLYVFGAYWSRASTVYVYALLLLCSSKQPKKCPFMPSVAPLNVVALGVLPVVVALLVLLECLLQLRFRFLSDP
jgi:hypothetical protein